MNKKKGKKNNKKVQIPKARPSGVTALVKNKNKNLINININSNNKRKVTSRPSQSQGHSSSVFVSSPYQPYLPQDQSIHHLYPIIENLKDKIDTIGKVPVSQPIEITHDKPVSTPLMGIKNEPADLFSKNYNDSIHKNISNEKKILITKLENIRNEQKLNDNDSMNTPVALRTRKQKPIATDHSYIPKYDIGSQYYKDYKANTGIINNPYNENDSFPSIAHMYPNFNNYEPEVKKKAGRPPGSKNKPKVPNNNILVSSPNTFL